MNEQVYSEPLIDFRPPWSLLFAKEVDQDLEFDEGLEDDELYQRKPPRRRPLLWILILLLAIGVVYWALGPDSSLMTNEDSLSDSMSPPRMQPLKTDQDAGKPFGSITVPTPLFREGQEVQLVQKPGQNTLSATLLRDANGTKPGPSVKIGETLTILDGEMIGENWIYKVRTQSGATGWVIEKSIKDRTS